jgi:tetratricopeptide (TPR) repeat protein
MSLQFRNIFRVAILVLLSFQTNAQEIKTKKDAILFLNTYIRLNKPGWEYFYLGDSSNANKRGNYALQDYKFENEFILFIIQKEFREVNKTTNSVAIRYGNAEQFILDLTDSIHLRKKGKKLKYFSYKNYIIDGRAINIEKFYDAIVLLKSSLDPKEKEAYKLAELKKGVIANLKTEISEEQRKYIVQANAANEKKEYDNAILLYRKVIELNPYTYPAAYFNTALIHGTMENYYQAVYAMKQYLIVAPDAEDARKAQDKIYEWELNVKPIEK